MTTKLFSIEPDQLSGAALNGLSEIQSIGVTSHKHGTVVARWKRVSWSPFCFFPLDGGSFPLVIKSLPFPTAPSLQLYCICGAITVRGRQETHSLQSCWLGWTLYLLWDTLWTCQIDSYFCLFLQSLALCRCLSTWACTLTSWGVSVHGTLVSLHSLVKFPNNFWTAYYHAFDSFSGTSLQCVKG